MHFQDQKVKFFVSVIFANVVKVEVLVSDILKVIKFN